MATINYIQRQAPIRVNLILSYIKMEENLYCFKLTRVIVAAPQSIGEVNEEGFVEGVDLSPFGKLEQVVRHGFTRKSEIDKFKKGRNTIKRLDFVLAGHQNKVAFDVISASSKPKEKFLHLIVQEKHKMDDLGMKWTTEVFDRNGRYLTLIDHLED
jgi:hypothetical protein